MLPPQDVEQPLDIVGVGLHMLESRASASLPIAEEGTGMSVGESEYTCVSVCGDDTCLCVHVFDHTQAYICVSA